MSISVFASIKDEDGGLGMYEVLILGLINRSVWGGACELERVNEVLLLSKLLCPDFLLSYVLC